MKMYPSDFAAAQAPVRLTLLAALCWARKAEMIDGLVELLIQLVHKISVRAEKKVENEINAEFRRVHGKNGILVKLAAAALALPEEIVRKTLYPVVGKRTLEDIVAEATANEKAFNIRVRVKLRGSYSHHYRRGLPKLLNAVSRAGRSGAGRARSRFSALSAGSARHSTLSRSDRALTTDAISFRGIKAAARCGAASATRHGRPSRFFAHVSRASRPHYAMTEPPQRHAVD